jgi:hypothetical protein
LRPRSGVCPTSALRTFGPVGRRCSAIRRRSHYAVGSWRAIAYQMQVNAYGGLSASAKRRLQQIAAAVRRGDPGVAGIAARIRSGTQLIRQWRDQTHTVTATNDGFEWNGQIFRSLSAIARQITGTNWNGYIFFGIKQAPPCNKNAAGSRSKPGVTP